MNIILVNADSIFWEADKNIRLVNFERILANVYEVCPPDQVYFIGGLEGRDPFNESMKDIISLQKERDIPIIPVSSITKFDEKHNPDIILIDLLYRGILMQKRCKAIDFTIVSADLSAVRSAHFLAHKGLINPVNFFLSDTVIDKPGLEEKDVILCNTISLKSENRTIEDKIATKTIMDTIRSGIKEDFTFRNPMSILQKKVANAASIHPSMTRPLVLSLIHHGVLARQKFTDNEGNERTGIVLGERSLEEALEEAQKES